MRTKHQCITNVMLFQVRILSKLVETGLKNQYNVIWTGKHRKETSDYLKLILEFAICKIVRFT